MQEDERYQIDHRPSGMHIVCWKFALVCDGIGLCYSHDLSNCCFTVKRASALHRVIELSQSSFIPSRGVEGEGRHVQGFQTIFPGRAQEGNILCCVVFFERKHRETPIMEWFIVFFLEKSRRSFIPAFGLCFQVFAQEDDMHQSSLRFACCRESTGGKAQIISHFHFLFWRTRKCFKYCRVWAQEDSIPYSRCTFGGDRKAESVSQQGFHLVLENGKQFQGMRFLSFWRRKTTCCFSP